MRTCVTCGQSFSGEAAFCPFDGTKLEGVPQAESAAYVPSQRRDQISVGALIGDVYRVDKVLGEGGMGIVFAVTHVRLGKRFALKLLKRELAKDADTRARFLVEAQAAGKLHHPNVVEVTDYASLPDGSAYLVMEYLDGQPLARLIKLGGAIPALRAVGIVRDVASGLASAHEKGIVHRDLKPDNVFVIQHGGKEVSKILDFGVAKVAGSAKLTKTGMVFGTPHYMSPEQASGGAIDGRTDVYALGVIMYEMFTGRVPFEADTYMGVLTKHMFEAPIPPSQLAGAARELGALEDVTLKALAKRPEDRYASMNDLIVDIDRIIRVGHDGVPVIASHVEGIRRPDAKKDIEQVRRALGLADELEPPARAEIDAAYANAREARGRRVGLVAMGAALFVGVTIGVAALAIHLRTRSGAQTAEQTSETPHAEPPPKTKPPPPIPVVVPVPIPQVEPVASTVPSTTAQPGTTTATQHPTPVAKPVTQSGKPGKKAVGSSDVIDPWAQ